MTKKKKKTSLGAKIATVIICVLMLGASGYFLWHSFNEAKTTYTLLTDIDDAKKELEALQKEQEKLVQQKEQLLDENYVKTWARGEYLITKEGEEIYKLPSQND